MSQEGRKLIAEKVKFYREKIGYSREQLSLLIDYDPSYISKVERQAVNIPIDILEKIAQALNISIKDFFI